MKNGFVRVDEAMGLVPGVEVDVKGPEGNQRLIFYGHSSGMFMGYDLKDADKKPIIDYCYGFMPEDITVKIVRR